MTPISIDVADIIARYECPRKLGAGGQKVVYMVQEPFRGQIVIKVGEYHSAQALERVRREVSTLSTIDSPYFPQQYGFEVLDDHRYLISEEFIAGKPLNDCIEAFCSEPLIIDLAIELVRGLGELWDRRIVHRDIKPANIMITTSGPKIIDLGIIRLLDATSLTHALAPVGPCTPAYASPEQLQNIKRDIDHRSDQFSLGIVLVQLILTGTHPFDPHIVGGESIPCNILRGLWASDQLDGRISSEFRTIIHRLLAAHPYMRYRSHDELGTALSLIFDRKTL